MTDPSELPTPASPEDLADALASAPRYQGWKRMRNADEIMAEIVGRRLVACLERAGVVVRLPLELGAPALRRGFRERRSVRVMSSLFAHNAVTGLSCETGHRL